MVFSFRFSVQDLGLVDLFGRFLAYHACQQNIAYATELNKDTYCFYIKSGVEQAGDFATTMSQRLPASLNFKFLGIEKMQDLELTWQDRTPIRPNVDILEMQTLLDKTSPLFGALETCVQDLIYLERPLRDRRVIQESFKDMAERIQQGQILHIATSRGCRAFSSQLLPRARVLFLDLSSLLSLTRMDKKGAQVLAAYEKPTTHTSVKEIFAKDLLEPGTAEIQACLPYDIVLCFLGRLLLDLDMPYVFMQESSQKACLRYTCPDVYVPDRCLTMAKNGLLIWHGQHTLEHALKALETSRHALIYLSFDHPSCFWIKEGVYKHLIHTRIDTNINSIIQHIQEHPKGKKLYANYKNGFGTLCHSLEQIHTQNPPSDNLLDLLGMVAQMLGLGQNLDGRVIFEHAKAFLRQKGPRIDFKLANQNGRVVLDGLATIKTAMSFHLAGVEDATLCFGVLDSLAEFLGNFIYDTCTNFSVDRVCLCGDVFLEKVFLDLCVEYFPKECTLIWPPFKNPC